MEKGGGLFARQGGKWRQRKHIFKRFPPTNSYTTYVEPFLGAGNIALESPLVKKMVAGDTDSIVVDIFNGIKKVPIETIRQFNFKHNKDLFDKLKLSRPKTLSEKLHKNLYLKFNSFASRGDNYNSNAKSSGIVLKRNLEKIKEILSHYTIVKKDYKSLIDKYDSPKTFFYLDPPYYNQSSVGYETGDIDHQELFNKLDNLKGLFLLSYNDDPYIRNLYKDYHITKFISTQANFTDGGVRKTCELLISNY